MGSSISLAYWLMPEQLVVPVALLLGGTGLFLKLIGLRRLGGSMLFAVVGLIVLPALLEPVLSEIFLRVPMWVVVLLLSALACYLLRLVLALFLGKEGAGTLLAMMVAGSLRKMVVAPSTLVRRMVRVAAFLGGGTKARWAAGIGLTVLLAAFSGYAGRQLDVGRLLLWNLLADTGALRDSSRDLADDDGRDAPGRDIDALESGSKIYRRIIGKGRWAY